MILPTNFDPDERLCMCGHTAALHEICDETHKRRSCTGIVIVTGDRYCAVLSCVCEKFQDAGDT